MQGMLGFTIMFVAILGTIVVSKLIVTSIGMFFYRLGFATYYFVKNEDVDYKILILKGNIVRPVKHAQIMSFSQVRHMNKSA